MAFAVRLEYPSDGTNDVSANSALDHYFEFPSVQQLNFKLQSQDLIQEGLEGDGQEIAIPRYLLVHDWILEAPHPVSPPLVQADEAYFHFIGGGDGINPIQGMIYKIKNVDPNDNWKLINDYSQLATPAKPHVMHGKILSMGINGVGMELLSKLTITLDFAEDVE